MKVSRFNSEEGLDDLLTLSLVHVTARYRWDSTELFVTSLGNT